MFICNFTSKSQHFADRTRKAFGYWELLVRFPLRPGPGNDQVNVLCKCILFWPIAQTLKFHNYKSQIKFNQNLRSLNTIWQTVSINLALSTCVVHKLTNNAYIPKLHFISKYSNKSLETVHHKTGRCESGASCLVMKHTCSVLTTWNVL